MFEDDGVESVDDIRQYIKSENELKEMGIKAKVHRSKIWQKIQETLTEGIFIYICLSMYT